MFIYKLSSSSIFLLGQLCSHTLFSLFLPVCLPPPPLPPPASVFFLSSKSSQLFFSFALQRPWPPSALTGCPLCPAPTNFLTIDIYR